MARRARGLVVAVLAVACGCRPAAAPEAPRDEAPPRVEADDAESGPSLEQIADAIDPGPRQALTVGMPGWISAWLSLPQGSDPAAQLVAAQQGFDSWTQRAAAGTDAGQLQALVELVRAIALAERAAGDLEHAPPEALVLLERVYDIVDVPTLANDHNLFAQMLQGVAGIIAQEGDPASSVQLEELASLVFDGVQRAGDLHRRTVAALLRTAPDHPAVADALSRTADSVHAQDEALAVGIMRRSLAVRGEQATAAHWLDLASLCHRSLDLRCGKQARARAEALAAKDDEAIAERLRESREQAENARAAVELRDAAGLEDRLDQAAALMALQRHGDAAEIYEHLHGLHPEDARPVAGMAKVVLQQRLDFVAAFEILERARPREHLDREWYGLVIGVRATALIYHVLPRLVGEDPDAIFDALRPELLQMNADIDSLEALGADEGKVLRYAYDLGMAVWPKVRVDDTDALIRLARAQLEGTSALFHQIPDSRHAYTMVLAAAELSAERSQALATLDLAPPSEHAEAMASRRALAAFDLVAGWDARERVGRMIELADEADGESQPLASRRLAIDARVVGHRLGQPAELAELERRYRELRAQPGGAADAVLLNNLAVVVAEQGRTRDALALWQEAEGLVEEGERGLLRLNATAARISAGINGAAERDALSELEQSPGTAEVRLAARAWRVAASSGADRRRASKELRRAAEEAAPTNYRPRNLPGEAGVVMRGAFQLGLGYSTREGLQIQLDTSSVPWLVVPCPVPIPDPRT